MITLTPCATILVHGGAGGTHADTDGCMTAANIARRKLDHLGDALDAAVAAVVSMENDGRFNAGAGAILGLDGETIEMDAAVMDSRGRLGSVACIQRVKNPVMVARDVAASPHRMLAGEGATHFARVGGHPDFYHPSDKARAAHRDLVADMAPDSGPYGMLWNYNRAPPVPHQRQFGCDTVGAIVRGPDGQFAVAASTGGSAPALLGRVGDTPLLGCGFFAGRIAAITVTGVGETIIPHLLAHSVYQWLAEGMTMERALARGLELFDDNIDIGILAVTATVGGSASKHPLPMAVL